MAPAILPVARSVVATAFSVTGSAFPFVGSACSLAGSTISSVGSTFSFVGSACSFTATAFLFMPSTRSVVSSSHLDAVCFEAVESSTDSDPSTEEVLAAKEVPENGSTRADPAKEVSVPRSVKVLVTSRKVQKNAPLALTAMNTPPILCSIR